jgi:hypothetical protein
MTQYLISFDAGAMDHIPEEDMPDVSDAVGVVRREAAEAGVFVFTGGLDYDEEPFAVSSDGTLVDGPYPESKELIGGLMIVDVPTRQAAAQWAAKVAVACRCPQDIRVFRPARPITRKSA